ncbi:MAG: 23S rRNA (uracil(1939)-C(5))-methyltransferase RlmD [Lachnospiraceae bacterium]|jgi:23S rRNA (uracil1939-C5)-methyltransferase|nr:23S rRNA (uracil(1939)-C(5))-methyltransferase RlmD [Lachnospiraceae bacterium]
MALQKNDIVELKIKDIGANGEGIGGVDDYTLFVKDAVIGDEIEAIVTKIKTGYGYGHLKRIIKPGKWRIKPACPVARVCGGCQLQALSYDKQLKYKENKVKNALIRIGKVPEDIVNNTSLAIIGMEGNGFRYRNKAQYPIGTDNNKPVAGFYMGHSHNIIPCNDCLLGEEINSKILKDILGFMEKYKIPAYDEKTGRGIVRHVLLRCAFGTGERMVCLIVRDYSPGVKSAAGELIKLLRSIDGIKSICLNINPDNTNVILGKKTVVLWGNKTIKDKLCNLEFEISAESFYQVNSAQTEKLYAKVKEFADLKGNERIWDLYCGIGTIGLSLAKEAKEVIGVEYVPEAVADARRNAANNSIINAVFCEGKAEDILPAKADEFLRETIPEVIVIDPPRKGCAESLLKAIINRRPQKVIYVSCDPATLSRDIAVLRLGGYELNKWQPVDMFPQTVSVETVTCLVPKDTAI